MEHEKETDFMQGQMPHYGELAFSQNQGSLIARTDRRHLKTRGI